MLEQYPQDVKLVFKNYPLSRHKHARKAAAAALAAQLQGKFWEFHHKLFEHYEKPDESVIQEIAGSLELDMDRFKRDMESSAVRMLISRDVNDARAAGVRGTPTVFVNGKQFKKRDFRYISQVIDRELRKLGGSQEQTSQ